MNPIIDARERFDAHYLADIVDLDDPLRLGRVRVHIHGMTENVEPEKLPWAQLQLGIGARKNRGYLPAMLQGDRVYVRFQDGDSRFPVIVASAHQGERATPESENTEAYLPAIGINGFRSTQGIRHAPASLPTSQTGDVPYLTDEVSLQHDILEQRRANRSWRRVHLSQGTQMEMTAGGDLTFYGPQSVWLNTGGELHQEFADWVAKGRQVKFELDGDFNMATSRLSLQTNAALNLDGGGSTTLGGVTVGINAMDAFSMLALNTGSIVTGTKLNIIAGAEMATTVATLNYTVDTLVGGISFTVAKGIGPSMELSPLSGVVVKSPLASLEMSLLSDIELKNQLGSLEIDKTGGVELKGVGGNLSISTVGNAEFKTMSASIKMNPAGIINIANNRESLGGIMRDLLMAIQNIDVQTGTGKSGKPNNMPEFQQIARRLQMLIGN